MTPSRPSPPSRRLAPAAALVLIAVATLVPGSGGGDGGGFACLTCGGRSLADFLVNVLLFAPLGAALAAGGARARTTVVAGVAVSFGVELAQVVLVPGRDAALRDLLANTAGAGVGWLLARALWIAPPRRRRAKALAVAWAAAVTTALAASPLLYRPAPTDRALYLQWTARFGDMEAYQGRVLGSRVGELDLPGPPGRIAATERLRGLITRRSPVDVTFLAGPPPPGLAPLFSLYDGAQVEVLLMGVDGTDVVFRHRTAGNAARLDSGPARFPGALAGVVVGDTASLRLRPGRGPGAWCLAVSSSELSSAGGSPGEACARAATPGRSWRLLHAAPGPLAPYAGVLDALWLFAVLLPAGLLAPGWRVRAAAATAAAAGLLAGPLLVGLPPTPVMELAAALAGVAGGGILAGRRRPRTGATAHRIDTPPGHPFLSRP